MISVFAIVSFPPPPPPLSLTRPFLAAIKKERERKRAKKAVCIYRAIQCRDGGGGGKEGGTVERGCETFSEVVWGTKRSCRDRKGTLFR